MLYFTFSYPARGECYTLLLATLRGGSVILYFSIDKVIVKHNKFI